MSLKHVLSILWRRLWLVLTGLIATLVGAAVVVTVVPPRYEATASASIDIGRSDPVTGAANVVNGGRGVVGGLISLIQSQRIAAEVVRRLNLAADPTFTQDYLSSGVSGQIGITEWIAQTISKSLDARSNDAGNVITITYRGPSAVQAALLANSFLSAFEDTVVELKVAAAQQTSTWLEPQLDKLRASLEESRQKLLQFQQTAKLLAPTQGGTDNDASPLAATSGDLASSKAQLLALQTQLSALDSGQANSQTSLLDTPALSQLKTSLASTISDLGRARSTLGSNNPKVQALLASQRSLQDQIAAELITARATATAKIKALQEQIAALQSTYSDQYGKLISVQGQRDQLASLQREYAFRQEQLDSASRAAASAKMQGDLSFSNVTTLDNATPPQSAAFPKIPLVAGLSVGAGLALGVIFALIAEALDRRIRVTDDLGFATDAPLLGVIAKSKIKSARRSRDKGFSISLPAAQS